MRIYHSDINTSEIFSDFQNKRKNMKKKYKSIDNLQQYLIGAKALGEKGNNQKKKKKILKKNIQFLQGIGLKVNNA